MRLIALVVAIAAGGAVAGGAAALRWPQAVEAMQIAALVIAFVAAVSAGVIVARKS
jgi:hypothetical protein